MDRNKFDTCSYCKHFKKGGLYYKGKEVSPGEFYSIQTDLPIWAMLPEVPHQCTLNPNWVNVTTNHYCGHFRVQSHLHPAAILDEKY